MLSFKPSFLLRANDAELIPAKQTIPGHSCRPCRFADSAYDADFLVNCERAGSFIPAKLPDSFSINF